MFLWLNNTLSMAEVGLKDTTVNKKQNRDVLLVEILGTNLIVSFPNHSYESKMYWKMKVLLPKNLGLDQRTRVLHMSFHSLQWDYSWFLSV